MYRGLMGSFYTNGFHDLGGVAVVSASTPEETLRWRTSYSWGKLSTFTINKSTNKLVNVLNASVGWPKSDS